MDFFVLKKIISAFIMPLSIIILLLLIALFYHKRQPKLSYKSLLIATLLLIVSAFPPLSDQIMLMLEDDYSPFVKTEESVDYIVVLGCYHTDNSELPATIQLESCALQRLVEAIRIYRMYPNATIITSGNSFAQGSSHAQTVKNAAISLGVPADKIVTENFPKDTEEEAELIAPRVQGSHVVLVTNADHMPRAMQYFKQQGITAIAAPASYMVKKSAYPVGWQYFIPKSSALAQTTVAWYETLGRAWQWLKQLF